MNDLEPPFRAHEIIADFVKTTEPGNDPVSDLMKATICQFLVNSNRSFLQLASDNDGLVRPPQVVHVMIQELRECVKDLQTLLNFQEERLQ